MKIITDNYFRNDKTPVSEAFFDNVADLRSVTLLKKGLWSHRLLNNVKIVFYKDFCQTNSEKLANFGFFSVLHNL